MLVMVVTLCVLLQPLQCATLERLSLDDMITRSSTILRGKVTASWPASTGSIIYTHYQIQVGERFKGAPGKSVEIVVPGGTLNGRTASYSGAPVLHPGDEFVFFLWTGKDGLTWITGLTQGLFSFAPGDTSTDPVTTRPASRELMLDPNTARPVKDTALSMKLSDLRTHIAATLAAQGGVN
jgi:hypothetical protein